MPDACQCSGSGPLRKLAFEARFGWDDASFCFAQQATTSWFLPALPLSVAACIILDPIPRGLTQHGFSNNTALVVAGPI